MNKLLPTKPIESVSIYFHGDPSVGIRSATFELSVYVDITCFSVDDVQEELDEIKKRISDLYEFMQADPPTWVMFDYELAEENRLEKEFDKQMDVV